MVTVPPFPPPPHTVETWLVLTCPGNQAFVGAELG